MIDLLSTRPLVQRGLSVATAGLLVAGSFLVPAAVRAAGPVANPDTYGGHQDDPTVVTQFDMVTNDEGDALVVTAASNAVNGTAVWNATTHAISFTPDPGVCDPMTGGFDYTVEDVDHATATGHVTISPITCNGTNSTPVGVNDIVDGVEDTPLVILVTDLTGNDQDEEHDPLHIVSVHSESGGVAVLGATTVTFTPTADLCGPAAADFDYAVSDGDASDNFVEVTVNLDCVNDAPVAVADVATVAMNSAAADHAVIGNDTDVDSATLHLDSVVSVAPSSAGSATKNGDLIHFTPATNYHGQAVVTYKVTDGDLTGTGTLTITIGTDVTPPVVAVPAIAFGSGRVNESAPLKVSWSAIDASSGVATYEVQSSLDGGAFRRLYIGTGKSVTAKFAFDKSIRIQVRATDKEGNTSGWVTLSGRKVVDVQDGNHNVSKSGHWFRVSKAGASGSGYAYTSTKGKAAKLAFTGRSIVYVATKQSSAGHVKVYVDGKLLGRFQLKSGSTHLGEIIAGKSWSTSGSHTIKVVNDNHRRATLDAFIVLR